MTNFGLISTSRCLYKTQLYNTFPHENIWNRTPWSFKSKHSPPSMIIYETDPDFSMCYCVLAINKIRLLCKHILNAGAFLWLLLATGPSVRLGYFRVLNFYFTFKHNQKKILFDMVPYFKSRDEIKGFFVLSANFNGYGIKKVVNLDF